MLCLALIWVHILQRYFSLLSVSPHHPPRGKFLAFLDCRQPSGLADFCAFQILMSAVAE